MDNGENQENQDDKNAQALKLDNQDHKEQLEQHNGFYKTLLEQLKQSDRASLGRHVWLTDSLKHSMKAQKQLAAAATETEDRTPKKGFFARFLRR